MSNIKIAQNRQKTAYDIRHSVDRTTTYKNGVKVLLKNFRRKKGLCTQTKYTGPYVISQSCGKGNFLLKEISSDKILGPYNQKSLKTYYETNDVKDSDDSEHVNDSSNEVESTNLLILMFK